MSRFKFKIGDCLVRFEKGSSHRYEVLNSNPNTDDYTILQYVPQAQMYYQDRKDFEALFERSNTGCSHEFVQYVGFRESFEYCKHCDQRKTL